MSSKLRMPVGALLLFSAMSAVVATAKEVLLEKGQEILVERNVAMVTRDGVTLRADVFRPNRDGKFPVILERIPYDKRIENFGPKAASQGYVFIVQDCRGRFASDGEWYPLRDEQNDGYDAVEWAAALPYANGKVGMFGFSYSALTQLFAAMASPPHLTCIMPGFMASDAHAQWVYPGGVFSQALNQGWSTALAINALERRVGRTAQPSHWDMKQPLISYPLLDVGGAAGLCDFYYDWVRHPAYDAYWKAWSVEEHFAAIKVPALHFGAWYDYFAVGTVRNYAGFRDHAGSPEARQGQRLVMMVGGHAGPGPKIGEVDYGKDSVVDNWALALRWFDHALKGEANGLEREKPVKYFVMGKNVWREADAWPVPGVRPTAFYLHSGGRANTLAGDGVLVREAPAAGAVDQLVYDPANPVPTVGGPAFGEASLKQGPYDQREVEKRPDVLVYTTAPFAEDLEIVGEVRVDLHVSSTAVDTDFTAKLVDVAPDGTAINLLEGIQRARYRNSRERAELMVPGEVYPVTVGLGPIAHAFLRGHRLRLEISSSNFPHFARNPNTGAAHDSGDRTEVTATNRIHHGATHASALWVEVAP